MSSSAVVMITWPTSPMPPPPIARRSTPRAAICSARSRQLAGLVGDLDDELPGHRASGLRRGARDRTDRILARPDGALPCERRGAWIGPPTPRLAGARSRAGTRRGSAAPDPVSQRKSTAMPRARRAAHAAGRSARSVARPLDAVDQRRRRRRVEHEARALVRVARRRRRPSRPGRRSPHDGRRPVAQRDHLALAARLEARRHQEQVGAGVDAAGHRRGRSAR